MPDNKSVIAGTFYAYEMRQEDRRYCVVFTKGGELYETYDRVFAAAPIEPPRWARNMWDVSEEAERVNHFAQLCDARCKTIISDTYEGRVKSDMKDCMRIVDFLRKLQAKEPWK